jgi:hypothetical protein
MSWHYLQGQEGASWADTSLDGAPSALLSLLPTRVPSCSQGNATECSPPSPYGMTCEPSTGSLGADTSTLSVEASPARTSALPERAMDLTESEADCGPKWPGSLARYNPGSRSWRTAQCSLLGGLTKYSATFPRWGMMRSGELWELPTPVLRIEGKGSGSWPTPNCDGFRSDGELKILARTLTDHSEFMGMTHRAANSKRVTAWPANTPSGNWPTQTCSDAFTDKLKSSQQQEGSMHSVNLSQAVKMWPTPLCQDAKGKENSPSQQHKVNELAIAVSQSMGGGQLNPDWVEWLMNWPIGWTSMEPLNPDRFLAWLRASTSVPTASRPSATDKFQRWCALHGIPSTPAI